MRAHYAGTVAELLALVARSDYGTMTIHVAPDVPHRLLAMLAMQGTHVYRNGDGLGFYGRRPTRMEQRALRRCLDKLLAATEVRDGA